MTPPQFTHSPEDGLTSRLFPVFYYHEKAMNNFVQGFCGYVSFYFSRISTYE
jgi:hypothetical protein